MIIQVSAQRHEHVLGSPGHREASIIGFGHDRQSQGFEEGAGSGRVEASDRLAQEGPARSAVGKKGSGVPVAGEVAAFVSGEKQFATWTWHLFEDDHVGAQAGGLSGRHHARRAGTDHDDIKGVMDHAFALAITRRVGGIR